MTIEGGTEIQWSLGTAGEVALTWAPGVFAPNATTSLLIRGARSVISKPVHVLDLGCGTGVVGLALHRHGLVATPLFASDLSDVAVMCSRLNYERHHCSADVRIGSLFDPWVGKRFDVIVDDISGICRDVAAVSPWFLGVPCNTGEDGTELIAGILRESPRYLTEGGKLVFPVLSLSNAERIVAIARERFGRVECVARQDWPLPSELKPHLPLLRVLQTKGFISIQERFGMLLCYTEVYCASEPNSV